MFSDPIRAEAWLARGREAYQKQRFAEAAEHFKHAVALAPDSLPAHLALAATHLTLYKKPPSPPTPASLRAGRDVSEAELRAYRAQQQAILAEQNSTHWPLAEESLQRAYRLDPQNQLVIEYLCALYFVWKDPLNEENHRLEEARQWFARLTEVDPNHRYAAFYGGMIASIQARKLLPHDGRFPPPPETDEDHEALRRKVRPLLEEATRHLLRALMLDPKHGGALHFMADVKSMEASLAETEDAARQKQEESAEWERKAEQVNEEARQAAGQPVRSGSSGTITFRPSPEALAEAQARPFPPNPWWI